MKWRTAGFTVTLALSPHLLESQVTDILEKILKGVTHANVRMISGGLTSADTFLMGHGLRGIGLELYYDLEADSSGSIPNSRREKKLRTSLAVGYSQITGILGRGLDLRTSLERLPSATFSLSYHNSPQALIHPYLGARMGLTQLKSMRVVLPGDSQPIQGTGATYHVGGVFGIAGELASGKASMFVEYARTYCRLQNVDWVSPAVNLPPSLLGEFDLDTWSLDVGVRVRLKGGAT
jgi:hypothetical protein